MQISRWAPPLAAFLAAPAALAESPNACSSSCSQKDHRQANNDYATGASQTLIQLSGVEGRPHGNGQQKGESGWDSSKSKCDGVVLSGQLVRQPSDRGPHESPSSCHGLPQPCNPGSNFDTPKEQPVVACEVQQSGISQMAILVPIPKAPSGRSPEAAASSPMRAFPGASLTPLLILSNTLPACTPGKVSHYVTRCGIHMAIEMRWHQRLEPSKNKRSAKTPAVTQ